MLNRMAFGYGCILLALVDTQVGQGRLGRILASFPCRILAFIGVYSYSIYLWHWALAWEPIAYRLHNTGALEWIPPEPRWIVAMTWYIAWAIVAGVILDIVVERPVLMLRDRFFPRRAPAIEQISGILVAEEPPSEPIVTLASPGSLSQSPAFTP